MDTRQLKHRYIPATQGQYYLLESGRLGSSTSWHGPFVSHWAVKQWAKRYKRQGIVVKALGTIYIEGEEQ